MLESVSCLSPPANLRREAHCVIAGNYTAGFRGCSKPRPRRRVIETHSHSPCSDESRNGSGLTASGVIASRCPRPSEQLTAVNLSSSAESQRNGADVSHGCSEDPLSPSVSPAANGGCSPPIPADPTAPRLAPLARPRSRYRRPSRTESRCDIRMKPFMLLSRDDGHIAQYRLTILPRGSEEKRPSPYCDTSTQAPPTLFDVTLARGPIYEHEFVMRRLPSMCLAAHTSRNPVDRRTQRSRRPYPS